MLVNEVVVGVGSNINPEENVGKAKAEINKIATVVKQSEFIYTKLFLYKEQADFLNGAFLVQTYLDMTDFKTALKRIEAQLGRIKTENKNGPVAIALDILIFNKKKIDKELLEKDFVKYAVKEVLPEFKIKKAKQ